MTAGLTFIALVGRLSAHHGEQEPFEARVAKDLQSASISVEWTTRTGFAYDLEASDKLNLWERVTGTYGVGQTVSVPVASFEASGGGGGALPSHSTVSVTFALSSFGNGKTLVSWQEDGEAVSAVADLSFHGVGDLPTFVGQYEVEEPDPIDPSGMIDVLYAIAATLQQGVWSDQLDGPQFDPNGLTAQQLKTFAILGDHYTSLYPDMVAAAGGQNAPPSQVHPPIDDTSGRKYYKVVEREIDSDGDGIPDWKELEGDRPTNPFLADSDGDGLNDWEEMLEGSDPGSADSDGDGVSDWADGSPNGPIWLVDTSGIDYAFDEWDEIVGLEDGGSYVTWRSWVHWPLPEEVAISNPKSAGFLQGEIPDLPSAPSENSMRHSSETVFEVEATREIAEGLDNVHHDAENEQARLWLSLPEARDADVRKPLIRVVKTVVNGGQPTFAVDFLEAVIPAGALTATTPIDLAADIPEVGSGTSISVVVSLHPVDIETPWISLAQLDTTTQQVANAPWRSTETVRIAKWENAYTGQLMQYVSDISGTDRDKFRVHVRGLDPELAEDSSVGITASAPDGFWDETYETEMEFVTETSNTVDMILVSNDYDDDFEFLGPQTILDNDDNDPSHITSAGGDVTFAIDVAGTTGEFDVPVYHYGKIKVKIIVITTLGIYDPVLSSMIGDDKRWTQHVFDQIGITVEWLGTSFETGPEEVDLTDDGVFFGTHASGINIAYEGAKLVEALGTKAEDDFYTCFYVPNIFFVGDDPSGVALNHKDMKKFGFLWPNTTKYDGNCVVKWTRSYPTTMAHELGHLLGLDHFIVPNSYIDDQKIMRDGGMLDPDSLWGSRRIQLFEERICHQKEEFVERIDGDN